MHLLTRKKNNFLKRTGILCCGSVTEGKKASEENTHADKAGAGKHVRRKREVGSSETDTREGALNPAQWGDAAPRILVSQWAQREPRASS